MEKFLKIQGDHSDHPERSTLWPWPSSLSPALPLLRLWVWGCDRQWPRRCISVSPPPTLLLQCNHFIYQHQPKLSALLMKPWDSQTTCQVGRGGGGSQLSCAIPTNPKRQSNWSQNTGHAPREDTWTGVYNPSHIFWTGGAKTEEKGADAKDIWKDLFGIQAKLEKGLRLVCSGQKGPCKHCSEGGPVLPGFKRSRHLIRGLLLLLLLFSASLV